MDDDDDNNNVNKYKITGGKNNGFNNEAFTHKRMYFVSERFIIESIIFPSSNFIFIYVIVVIVIIHGHSPHVNKYKITGGKNNGFNNEAFTHKRMYKEKRKGCITFESIIFPSSNFIFIYVIVVIVIIHGHSPPFKEYKNPPLFIGADFCIL
jgi:preprotein translocase subunit SecE